MVYNYKCIVNNDNILNFGVYKINNKISNESKIKFIDLDIKNNIKTNILKNIIFLISSVFMLFTCFCLFFKYCSCYQFLKNLINNIRNNINFVSTTSSKLIISSIVIFTIIIIVIILFAFYNAYKIFISILEYSLIKNNKDNLIQNLTFYKSIIYYKGMFNKVYIIKDCTSKPIKIGLKRNIYNNLNNFDFIIIAKITFNYKFLSYNKYFYFDKDI